MAKTQLGCFTYETWSKIIGWFELTTGSLSIIILILILIPNFSFQDDFIEEVASIPPNATVTEADVLHPSVSNFVVTFFCAAVLYQVLYTTLAVYLLVGVYKKNPRHVVLWVIIKTGLLMLAVFSLVAQFILLFFGHQFDFAKKVIYIVIDTACIIIVFTYYKETQEIEPPSDLE